MEKSPKYNDFLTSVTDSKVFNKWLKDKGFKNTQEYLAEIVRRYKLVGKNYTETDPKTQGEMIASFVGDVLFAEDDSLDRFVSELTEEKKRTFGDLVRDFIDWIKGIFGKTDEVRMLEKKYAELFGSAKTGESKNVLDKTNDAEYNVDESQYAHTPTINVGGYSYTQEQYNNFGWVRANNVINAGYWRNFTENFAQAVKGNY